MTDFSIYSLTPDEVAKEEGFETLEDLLIDVRFSSIIPACCSYGCQVEPDGTCEHGFVSIFIALGVV